MDVTRYGAQRYVKLTKVLSGLVLSSGTEQEWDDNVHWDADTKQIVISAAWVPLGDGRTNHNYEIRLSLEDVSALVTILGHAGSVSDASLLRNHLRKQVPALVKLLACATGLVPRPMTQIKPSGKKYVSN